MRPVNVEKLKVRFKWVKKRPSSPQIEQYPIDVCEINEECLVFKRPISINQLRTLDQAQVSFRVMGKWRTYDLCGLRPSVTNDSGDEISEVSFSLGIEEERNFRKDLGLARR